ncbi:MAG: DHH family phosphoesterase [Candidatus Cloacimonadota bacterium]|nr:DHH family phosphoesterase [Candidatus Cloacimonadota bacterium]
MKENWIINSYQDKDIEKSILLGRGIVNYKKFLFPTLDKLSNPFLLADGEKAAKRIISAVEKKEKIFIFGHDDVDGVTSTVLLYKFLTKLGSGNHFYYIPNREYERYGIQKNFKDKVLKDEAKLVITVDIGINDIEAIDFFNKHSIDTIVLDHHIIFRKLPDAFAVVNPKRKDCPKDLPRHDNFPFNMLAGVGVVYNIVKIIEKLKGLSFDYLYPILAGIGTIADRMPLIDDNRIFASANWRIENIEKSKNLFIGYFIELNRNLSKSQIFNKLIKLITAGREKNGNHLGVEILLANCLSEVKEKYNILQRRLEKNNKEVKAAIKFIDERFNNRDYKEIFIYYDKNNKIPIRFIGLTASYIADKYRIPSLVLTTRDNNILSAESRGPEEFDWIKSFNKIKGYLIQYGGHKRAAGFTCYASEFKNIERELEEIAKKNSTIPQNTEYLNHKIYIDYQLQKENFNLKFFRKIFNNFAPYGEKNSPPIFLINNVSQMELERCNIENIPDISDRKKLNILVSFNDSIQNPINIIDYEIVN